MIHRQSVPAYEYRVVDTVFGSTSSSPPFIQPESNNQSNAASYIYIGTYLHPSIPDLTNTHFSNAYNYLGHRSTRTDRAGHIDMYICMYVCMYWWTNKSATLSLLSLDSNESHTSGEFIPWYIPRPRNEIEVWSWLLYYACMYCCGTYTG